MALIDRGKLLAYDSIENLENVFKAKKIYVELLRPLEPKQIGKIEKLKNVRAISTEEKRLTISFEGGEAEQAELLAKLVKDVGVQVVSFKLSLEALEEVYLQLVKEGS
ncbi:MAG: DUF4162 domain-containing protein [Candidatus Bathyarchaeia archaeon]|nr:DUF4162 domain-containing protein [Candidatus Bathyarchaeia archaeon]